jgi:Protein kinase domain
MAPDPPQGHAEGSDNVSISLTESLKPGTDGAHVTSRVPDFAIASNDPTFPAEPKSPQSSLGQSMVQPSEQTDTWTTRPPEDRDHWKTKPPIPSSLEGKDASLPAIPGYEIFEEMGHGGMGVVFRAFDRKLKRLVALKMILAGTRASADLIARFRSEAEAVAQLKHPNIVQIYEIGEDKRLPVYRT